MRNQEPDPSRESTSAFYEPILWIGGVVQPHGLRGVRIAAWIDAYGYVIAAAIVKGHGPSVLRVLLIEALAQVPGERRPEQLEVWPADREAVAGLQFPPVEIEHDALLSIVVADQVFMGNIPGDLPVRDGGDPKRPPRVS